MPPTPPSPTPLSPTTLAIVVYTDGSCLGNPGPGGWAWAVPDGPFASGADPQTTNQRMEITAVLEALRALQADAGDAGVDVVSDSTYVVNCFRDRWWEGWQRRGWRNSAGQAGRQPGPVGAAARAGPRPGRPVRFQWVKGHSGDRWNDVVDQLATAAAAAGAGRSGP